MESHAAPRTPGSSRSTTALSAGQRNLRAFLVSRPERHSDSSTSSPPASSASSDSENRTAAMDVDADDDVERKVEHPAASSSVSASASASSSAPLERVSSGDERDELKAPSSTSGRHVWRAKYSDEFPWLRYDAAQNAMYCKSCEAAKKRGDRAATGRWITAGVTNFKRKVIADHVKDELHLQLIENTELSGTLDRQFSRLADENREAITRAAQVVYFLAKQELPQTHFIPIKQLISSFGPNLTVECDRDGVAYEHDDFITESLRLCAQQIKSGQVLVRYHWALRMVLFTQVLTFT